MQDYAIFISPKNWQFKIYHTGRKPLSQLNPYSQTECFFFDDLEKVLKNKLNIKILWFLKVRKELSIYGVQKLLKVSYATAHKLAYELKKQKLVNLKTKKLEKVSKALSLNIRVEPYSKLVEQQILFVGDVRKALEKELEIKRKEESS